MRRFGSDRMKAIMNTLKVPEDQPIESGVISKQIEGAQKKVEGHNFDIRRYVLEYDDVMNKHREIMYKRRQSILEAWANEKYKVKHSKFDLAADNKSLPYPGVKTLKDRVLDMVAAEIEDVVDSHTRTEIEQDWDTEEIMEVLNTIFPIPNNLHQKLDSFREKGGTEEQDTKAREDIKDYLEEEAEKAYEAKEKTLGYPVMREIERAVLLRTIDSLWSDHLDEMQTLREGIGLRGYGQRRKKLVSKIARDYIPDTT